MWRTDFGERILKGKEAIVFAAALQGLISEPNLVPDGDYDLGIDVFDRLTYGQKIQALHIIANGLLTDQPAVELTAVLEGAIASVFEHLRTEVTVEIDISEERDAKYKTFFRDRIVAARKESEDQDLPSPDCDDIDEWDIEIESLKDLILWDNDYLSEDDFVDAPPEKSEYFKGKAGINKDYYTAIVDDPDDKAAALKLKELRNLCQSVIQGQK